MLNRQPEGRDTGEGSSGTAIVDPGGGRVAKTTDELLQEQNLLLRAMVIGLAELIGKGKDLFKEVGLKS